MNWTNYFALTDYLKTMDPALFHYGYALRRRFLRANGRDPCGCVATCVSDLTEAAEDYLDASHIRDFLAITTYEAVQVFGWTPGGGWSVDENLRGEAGIREALSRLAAVAGNYGGEPSSREPVSTVQPDETSFLASVRALITQPLVESEQ